MGAKYAVIPLVKIFAEVGIGVQMYHLDEMKYNGEKDNDLSKAKSASNSQALLFGAEIAF